MTRARLASTLVIAVAAVALASPPAALARTQRTSFVAIEQQVMCVTCGIPLVEADSVAAQQEKAFIQGLVSEGDTAAQIKSQLVAQYGASVLALPPDRGFNVAFYLVPVAAALLGLAAVAILLPRWRRNRRSAAATTGALGGESISAEDSVRLEADLARFDR